MQEIIIINLLRLLINTLIILSLANNTIYAVQAILLTLLLRQRCLAKSLSSKKPLLTLPLKSSLICSVSKVYLASCITLLMLFVASINIISVLLNYRRSLLIRTPYRLLVLSTLNRIAVFNRI
jgi:hypothetical protein